MNFRIVKNRYKYIYAILAIMSVVLLLIPKEIYPIKPEFILCIAFILFIFFNIQSYRSHKVYFIGELNVSENAFIFSFLNNSTPLEIKFEEIEKVVMWYIAFKGEIPQNASSRSFVGSKGGNNELNIHINGKIQKYYIYMETQADAFRFKLLYKELKDKNVNVIFK